MLDVAAGVGFTGFALAPHAAAVVAYDLTTEMLHQAIGLCQRRGLANVSFVQGAAEHLPFPNASLDIYTCRTAPHHFFSVPHFLSEAYRVVRPGGQFLMADTVTVADALVDRWQNKVELLRDPSHVRDYAPSEWFRLLGDAGWVAERTDLRLRTHLSFCDWVERSGSSPDVVQELRRLFASAPPAADEAFQITSEGDDFAFSWPVLVVRAVRATGKKGRR